MIIGGLWPLTDPSTWSDAADVFHTKAGDLVQESNEIRQTANGLPATNQRGDAIDGFVGSAHDSSNACSQQSEDYGHMATAAEEVGRTIYGLREDLDRIDSQANDEIQRLIDEARRAGHQLGLMATLMAKINEVVATARANATAASASAAAHIAGELRLITGDLPSRGASDGRELSVQPASWDKGGSAPEHGGMPQSPVSALDQPKAPSDYRGGVDPQSPQDYRHGTQPGDPETVKTEGGDSKAPSDAGAPTPSAADGPVSYRGLTDPASKQPNGLLPGSFPGGSASTPSPLGGSSTPTGGGFSPPSTSGLGQMGSTGSGLGGVSPASGLGGGTPASGLGGGTPASGLSSPGGLGTPSAGGGGAPAGASDFTRGFNAGAASGGAPLLPPPAAPQPSPGPAAGSGAPAGGFTSGPAQVSTASGAPTAAPTPVSGASAPVGGAGGGGMPGAPMGALPPFNSDVPRPAPTASVTPASGPPVASSAPAPSSGAAGPSVTALPPGVMGSGVGAAAGAGAGLSSPVEDPQLAAAAALVYELAHASRLYGTVDWCVGVFKTPAGAETVVVGNEGAGFIPRGVFVPRSARMLFCDSGLGVDFRRRWFAWANPAQTMLAYANLLTDHNPNIELYALATSTDHGGSALPAQAAGVPHYEDCSLARSPIPADANPAALDEGHAHRLETLDRGMYARLTGVAGSAPDRSEAWTATVAGVRTALERAASIKEVVVPPEIRAVLEVLSRGEAVAAEQWQALEFAGLSSVLQSASQRPGHGPESGEASPFARAYHNLARASELLLMWTRSNDLPFTEIAYTAAHIVSEAQLWPAADR